MKKYWLLFYLLTSINSLTKGQTGSSPVITFNDYQNWNFSVDNPIVSDDGKFTSYSYEGAAGSYWGSTIRSTGSKLTINLQGAKGVNFFKSQLVVYIQNDTLKIMTLATRKAYALQKVESYKYFRGNKSDFILYDTEAGLSLRILGNSKVFTLGKYKNYWLSEAGQLAVSDDKNELFIYHLSELGYLKKRIYNGECHNLIFDNSGEKVAFVGALDPDESIKNAIYYYENGMPAAKAVMKSQDFQKESANIKSDFLSFNSNGNKIFFRAELPRRKIQKNPNITDVDIWSYKDEFLQSEQKLSNAGADKTECFAVVNIGQPGALLLDNGQSESLLTQLDSKGALNYILVKEQKGDFFHFNSEFWPSLYLVSTKDGSRTKIFDKPCRSTAAEVISPNEGFVLWMDDDNKKYNSYEVKTGKTYEDLTRDLSSPLAINLQAGFSDDGIYLVVYDEFDIWKVDLKGLRPPSCLTKFYGKRTKTRFRFYGDPSGRFRLPLNLKSKFIFSAFNTETKNAGFVHSEFASLGSRKLNLQPFNYCFEGLNGFNAESFKNVKARNKDLFIVKRMSATEPSNFFLTSDFEKYQRLSDIKPLKKYNWYTTELAAWNTKDGRPLQGILYKPQNFDATKKYPVIFTYYEKRSDELNIYRKPGLSAALIDIPTYVSNGYIVFVIDMDHQPAKVGERTVVSIESAVEYLKQFNWVNMAKLGINGHSFGGYQTYYILTHSKLFAAASSAAGVSNTVSSYGTTIFGFGGVRHYYETGTMGGAYGIGVTPWNNPDVYIKGSPIFSLHHVSTPLLMMHLKDDSAVPYDQAIEIFTGLRRAQKKVWFLEYREGIGQHSLEEKKEQLDYTTRMMQFFDHYLKDKPAPLWMIDGIQYKDKGTKTGLELDSLNRTP